MGSLCGDDLQTCKKVEKRESNCSRRSRRKAPRRCGKQAPKTKTKNKAERKRYENGKGRSIEGKGARKMGRCGKDGENRWSDQKRIKNQGKVGTGGSVRNTGHHLEGFCYNGWKPGPGSESRGMEVAPKGCMASRDAGDPKSQDGTPLVESNM